MLRSPHYANSLPDEEVLSLGVAHGWWGVFSFLLGAVPYAVKLVRKLCTNRTNRAL